MTKLIILLIYLIFPQKNALSDVFINYLPQSHCGIGIGRCLALIITPVRGSSRVQRKIRGQTRPHFEQVVIAIKLTSYFSGYHHFTYGQYRTICFIMTHRFRRCSSFAGIVYSGWRTIHSN